MARSWAPRPALGSGLTLAWRPGALFITSPASESSGPTAANLRGTAASAAHRGAQVQRQEATTSPGSQRSDNHRPDARPGCRFRDSEQTSSCARGYVGWARKGQMGTTPTCARKVSLGCARASPAGLCSVPCTWPLRTRRGRSASTWRGEGRVCTDQGYREASGGMTRGRQANWLENVRSTRGSPEKVASASLALVTEETSRAPGQEDTTKETRPRECGREGPAQGHLPTVQAAK